jgi:ferredoxin
MVRKNGKLSDVDVSGLAGDDAKNVRRGEILDSLGAREFFVEGSIVIERRICRGVDCRLCIKVCPTNALFWKAGEVGLMEELCVYCGACVLSCIVDDCIKVTRKRLTGEVESFSKPKDFLTHQSSITARKRLERIREVFLKSDDYLNRREKSKSSKH